MISICRNCDDNEWSLTDMVIWWNTSCL